MKYYVTECCQTIPDTKTTPEHGPLIFTAMTLEDGLKNMGYAVVYNCLTCGKKDVKVKLIDG